MKDTKIISVVNFKGGVGKSTITYNLGAELNRLGYSVLLIDFDGQGTLTKFTGIEKEHEVSANLITILKKTISNEEINEAPIYEITPGFDIIPCDISKEGWSNSALSVLARETILKRAIRSINVIGKYDYVLIDNAPSINLDLQNSLVASDYYLLVTEPESASTDGTNTVFSIIAEIKRIFNLDLNIAGIVINKVDMRTNLHFGIVDVIKRLWGDENYIFNNYIPKSIVAPESQYMHIPICDHEPKSKIADAFRGLTMEFVERTTKEG